MKEVPATYMYSCLYEFTMPDVKETPKNKLMQYFTGSTAYILSVEFIWYITI